MKICFNTLEDKRNSTKKKDLDTTGMKRKLFDEPHGPQSFWFSFGHVLECWYVVECIINIMMIILIYLVQDIVICSKYLVTQSVENLVNIMKILIPKMKLVSR